VTTSPASADTSVPAAVPPLVRYGNFLFRSRDAVFPAVLVLLFVVSRPHWPRGSQRLDDALDAIGFGIAALGQALRTAVVGYAYIIRGGRDRKVYAEDLVTGGFFNHSRNPLYVGNLLILLGLLVIWNGPLAYAIGVPFFLFGYVAIVAAEEAFLRREFGAQYDAYAARVPRWWPRLAGLAQSTAGMRFNWRRVVLKEYGSAAYWVAGAFVLMLADSLAHVPWSARPRHHALLVAGVVAVAALWGYARWLKLSRRLTEDGPALDGA
jgi:protein-S-isoprenylcysteine O-methyltransferase Ste14